MKFNRTRIFVAVACVLLAGLAWLVVSKSSDHDKGASSVAAAKVAVAPLADAKAATSSAGSPAIAAPDARPAVLAKVAGSGQAVAAPAPASAPVTSASKTVASLGSLAVSQAEVERLLQSVPASRREQLQQNRPALDQWLRGRLAEEALLAQARNQGWGDRPEVKELAQAAQRQIVLRTYLDSVSQVPKDYPGKEELAAAYEAAKAQFVTPARYRISQIYIKGLAEDGDAVAKARKQAADVVKRARAADADFGALAKQYSQDQSSAAQGGDIGWAPLQQLAPDMRSVVAAMKKGAVSDPVQSPAGFHILKLVDQQPAATATLAQVEDQLREALRRQRKQQVAQAYLEGLVDAGTLSIDGAALNAAFDAVP